MVFYQRIIFTFAVLAKVGEEEKNCENNCLTSGIIAHISMYVWIVAFECEQFSGGKEVFRSTFELLNGWIEQPTQLNMMISIDT